jgi:Zn-dependent peptidase ImmA (M78 family)
MNAEVEVPHLESQAIEAAANDLLREYSKKFGQAITTPVQVERIAEIYLQLVLEFKDMKAMFPMADVHGAIWFEEGLIAIDERLDPEVYPLMLGRYRFTLAHEVGHWCLHRHLFLLQDAPEQLVLLPIQSRVPDVVCRSLAWTPTKSRSAK